MDYKVKDLSLTCRQITTLKDTWDGLIGKSWSFSRPIFLLNRCWLSLDKIRVDELSIRLPPDKSAEAPELIRYHQLLSTGKDHLIAIQECWAEFGIEDFHRAIRDYWHHQDAGNNGWTFNSYLKLIYLYRKSFLLSEFSMPVIVLGRQNSGENHFVKWFSICKSSKMIRFSSSLES